MAGGRSDGRPMRAVDARDGPEKLPRLLVNDHHAIRSADEEPMRWRIGHDVVPAAVAAKRKRLGDPIGRRGLQRGRGKSKDDDRYTHVDLLIRTRPRAAGDACPSMPDPG